MTIGKKLYSGFGAIVAIMVALFFVSVLTIAREHSARSVASATLSDMQTLESIRFQVMLEELVLRNFLLSGDVRDEGELASVHTNINTQLRDAESHAHGPGSSQLTSPRGRRRTRLDGRFRQAHDRQAPSSRRRRRDRLRSPDFLSAAKSRLVDEQNLFPAR